MEIIINIPKYNSDEGVRYKWEDGFEIVTKVDNGIISIIANQQGLISLANHFLNLAQDGIASSNHLHLDNANSLEEGSVELIIQRK